MDGKVTEIAGAAGVEARMKIITNSDPTNCNAALQGVLVSACRQRGYSFRRMPSGAGHDAAYLAKIGPSAMIFIPCVDGRSHCAEEWTSMTELEKGANILLDAVLSVDAQ